MDEGLAVKQAKELYNAGIGKRMGTDKKTFIRILSKASRPQIKVWLAACVSYFSFFFAAVLFVP